VRLLFVSPFYPPYAIGGAEHSTFALADALSRRGHAVTVLAPRLGPQPPDASADVVTVEAGIRLERPGSPPRPRVFDRPDVHARLALHVARAARGADLVHCQTLHLLPAAWAAARATRTPIVATIRDLGGVCSVGVCLLDAPRVPADCGVRKLTETCIPRFLDLYAVPSRKRAFASAVVGFATARGRSWLLRRCDAVFSVSAGLAGVYGDAGLIRGGDVDVLHNVAGGISASTQPADGYALFVGKVSHGKGARELLAAVDAISRRLPEFRLIVVGSAHERWVPELESRAGVEYLGWRPRSELTALYAGARFAVVPSTWPEPLPRAALEAAAAGVPVVGTRVGGIPEVIVDGETGILVEPRDADGLVAAMTQLWVDPELARRLGAAARNRAAKEFGPDAIARRAEELYKGVLASRAPR
jgi:glycogen(starch) synthase